MGGFDRRTFDLSPIRLTSGTNGFSGNFSTSLSGINQCKGLFTGPAAHEAVGAWALPVSVSGELHQAFGAWIAKRN